ncbi:MAG: potassium transporter TrkG [Clostridia bacterium]
MIAELTREKAKKTPPIRTIVYSFVVVILIGTILLTLPFSSNGERVSILDSAFTATSATCVTGLSLFDTYSTFSFFGQAVILLLIQVGGLGFATFATAFTLLMRKKLGFRNLIVYSESAGTNGLDIISLLKVVIIVTFSCELIGALLLMIRLVPLYGALGAWASCFVSISAFCNAGFDVLGFIEGNSSASAFVADPLFSLTISALIFIGSLGFLVIQDIFVHKVLYKIEKKPYFKLSFHSQICLRISAILLLVGALGFFVLEYNNTMKDLNVFEKIIASIFQSVNTRTAGFASVDIGAQNDITKLLTIFLMFIGGSPGSTAGGIKVTTFVVIASTIVSTMRSREDVVFLSCRFAKKTVYKAITVMFLALIVVVIDLIVLNFFNPIGNTLDTLFESVSAFATVGLSTGVTADLNIIGKIVIIITMFLGRVGPASFGIAILLKGSKRGETIYPEGRMLIG